MLQSPRIKIKSTPSFILIISLLLVIGFSCTSIVSYVVANNALNQYIRTSTLPLTSDNIYSEIQRDILPTIAISSLMAQDTFVRDWILNGEENADEIVRYLSSIQERYNMTTAFFISDDTLNYYHSSGVLKQVSEDSAQDDWYFDIDPNGATEFETNIDIDTADLSRTNFFVNHKVFDYEGNYLGIIGVGLASKMLTDLIEFYQSQYDRQVYFVDRSGTMALHGEQYQGAEDIHETEGLQDIATEVLSNSGGSYSYIRDGQDIFMESRFIPDLNWYLNVEQIGKPEPQIQQTLWVNLSLSFLITALILLLAKGTIGKYQNRLVAMAMKDKLTGINNRHAFDPALQQMLNFSARHKQSLCIVLADIDYFKKINDEYGHIIGDQVIKRIAAILEGNLRESDLLCRWGGEEFMLLLSKCELNDAKQIAEKIRSQIENTTLLIDGHSISVTTSFGVYCYSGNEPQSEVLRHVDKALYTAKHLGRNRVEIA